jgi:hypothetical protein
MARRGGKAASRRSRQRRTQQRASQANPAAQPTQPTQPVQPASTPPLGDGVLDSSTDVGSGDAFEKADAELRASTPPPGSRAGAPPRAPARTVRARTTDFYGSGGPSRLTEAASAEYHYVARDLRNIAVLLVVLAVLLAGAVLLVNVVGIGRV